MDQTANFRVAICGNVIMNALKCAPEPVKEFGTLAAGIIMPVDRQKLPAGFSEIPNSPSRIQCNVCTKCSARDVVMNRSSKASHITTALHKRALLRSARMTDTNGVASNTEQGSSSSSVAVLLSAISRYVDDVAHQSPDQELFDPFAGVDMSGCDFLDPNGHKILFSAGKVEDEKAEIRRTLDQQLQGIELLEGHTIFGTMSSSLTNTDVHDEDDTNLTELEAAFELLGIEDLDGFEEDFQAGGSCNAPGDNKWSPYRSKTMFMLDMLDNLPRLRLSDDHLKAIIWVMRECGTPDVPSFRHLRQVQAAMYRDFACHSVHHTSSIGNHFFANHPAKLVALDWANPLVRPHLHVYPEVCGPVKEFWQGRKWRGELPLDELSPMWAEWKKAPHRHYYLKEMAQQSDGGYVVLMRWVTMNGVVYAEVLDIVLAQSGFFQLSDPNLRYIPADSLRLNVLDLQEKWKGQIAFHPSQNMSFPWLTATVNPLRAIANGRPMFRIRVMTWSDDVSGNVSKQYNSHTNVYVQNIGIPHKKLSQEYFVRFVSTSPNASSSEQLAGISSDFAEDAWHDAYDSELEQDVLFQLIQHLLPADNPQQSEHCSHIGVKGNLSCRRDTVGGTREWKESDEGYKALFQPGPPRPPDITIQSIRAQLRIACLGNKDGVQSLQTQSGVKDKLAQHWVNVLVIRAREQQDALLNNPETQDPRLTDKRIKGDARKAVRQEIMAGIQDSLWNWLTELPFEQKKVPQYPCDLVPGFHYNVLLSTRGLDPHQDTPVEILHTYLLGNDKYIWHETSSPWDKKKEELFAVRLQSSSFDGLHMSAPPRARYLVQYKNSLIGKHFKCLQQLAVFHLTDLCTEDLFNLWKTTGELGAYLWFPEVENMDQYIEDLNILIGNLLDAWSTFDPNRIITKAKLHVLTHLVDDICRFGPAILYSTEVFECWNAVFRMCSILSNHLAPSKDIALTLGRMERFKHQVSGGWWKNKRGENVRASAMIRSFLHSSPELQRRLGWVDTSNVLAGTIKLVAQCERIPSTWDRLLASSNLTSSELTAADDVDRPCDTLWIRGAHVLSRSLDLCKEQSWIFFNVGDNAHVGQIRAIACTTESRNPSCEAIVLVSHFNIGPCADERLNMPILIRSGKTILIRPRAVQFNFNAQHDCRAGACTVSDGEQVVMQERLKTTLPLKIIKHRDDKRYILNMHALHNSHLIRGALPRELVAPKPSVSNRAEQHRQIAEALRVSGPAKRAESKEKAKATRELNKSRKAAAQAKVAPSAMGETSVDGIANRELDVIIEDDGQI